MGPYPGSTRQVNRDAQIASCSAGLGPGVAVEALRHFVQADRIERVNCGNSGMAMRSRPVMQTPLDHGWPDALHELSRTLASRSRAEPSARL